MDERKKQKAAHASEQENNRSYPEKGDERDGTRNAGEGGASPLGEVDEKGSGRDIEASPRDSEIEKEKKAQMERLERQQAMKAARGGKKKGGK